MAWEMLNEKEASLAHLGITATHVRKIKSGNEYEKYFEAPTGTNELINNNATVHDTLDFVGVLVLKTLGDTKRIANILKKDTLPATLKNIFDFFYQHYQYKLDEIGIEQVRRPSRAWADRKEGVDCDCFTASVSSVLTNLGIEHYLKIIAINGRPDFQHIYVVVPKKTTSNINSRAQYWVIDPVLNSFDEEAPKITQTKHLKMNGIPLQQLNGIEEVAGLGNEFEGIDDELNGLSDDQLYGSYKRRLLSHVRKTRQKIQAEPESVSRFYKPDVLVRQYQKLEGALESGSEEQLEGVLEHLSDTEHEAFVSGLAGMTDEISGHDDALYGHLFGNVDERMIDSVMGLSGKRAGKKAAKKVANNVRKASGVKKGHFTKMKNGTKAVKSGKFKGKLKKVVKKVGRAVKKTNPLAIAARGGFLVAMRTNFAKIAEKAYWGYQTRDFAKSKGLTDEYYDACVALLARIKKVYIDKLGGNESTIKKPIMNGRAAKKIAKAAKSKGMSGGMEELYGLGSLGSAAASGASITAAMAFLTPILAFMKKSFKGKKAGKLKNENGSESDSPSDNGSEEVDNMNSEANSPSDTTVDNDGSIEAADNANNEEQTDDDDSNSKKKVASKQNADQGEGSGDDPDRPKSNKGAIVGGVVVLGIAAAALAYSKNKKANALNGLGNFSAKRESKNLQTKLKKQGVKMPHGYRVEKLKRKPVKTIRTIKI